MNLEPLYLAQRLLEGIPSKLILLQNNEDTLHIRGGQVDKLQHASSTSLALNLFIDGRDGFYYTNNLETEELKSFVRQAVEATRLLEPDENRTLADPARYYRGDGPELRNFDADLNTMDPALKIQLAMDNNRQLLGCHEGIISAETRYSDRQHRAWYLISNGFEGYEESSWCTLSSILTVEGQDGQHPMDGWGKTRLFFRDLPHDGIANIALERTLRKIGQRPYKSGTYTMVVESPVAGNMVQPLLSAMSGQALQQRTSFLMDKLHQQVASPLLNMVDDPLIPGTRGACHFDYDGVATQQRVLFQKGRLETYFIDTPYGRKLGMEPTTQGTHHLILQPGERNLKEMLRRDGTCILVTDFNGGNCDPTTGNFSYGIEGLLIEDGKITMPISGMNITGNMLELWQNLAEVSNDADPWETDLIPSLLFRNVKFSGI